MGGPAAESHLEDARLAARAAAGDMAAFRQLFDAHAPRVYRTILRMVGDPEDAEDLTQEVFIRTHARLASLRDAQAFHAWLTRLAVNIARDHLRRRRPPTRPLEDDGGEGTPRELPAPDPSPEAQALTDELAGRVQEALLALPLEFRTVAVLHHVEGLGVDEIARALRVPVGTVKSRLYRARAELRRRLAGYVEEG